MSGTRQVEFTLSGQSTDWSNQDAARIFIERIVVPVMQKVRNSLNQLTRDVIAVSSSQLIPAKYGLVLANATNGPITLNLVHPEDNFHPVVVVKTDATANAVTVRSIGGENINSGTTDVLTGQWAFSQYESNASQYYKTNWGTLAGDVTGTPGNNFVSKLQGITLTAAAPTTGQVLMYDGTQWLPVSRNLRVLDNTYSPVGNWSFDVAPGSSITDLSGNGCTLTVEAGTMRTTTIHPTLGGVYFDGATDYFNNTPQTQLQILSDLTVLCLFMWTDIPAAASFITLFSYGAAGETEDTNCLYLGQIDSSSQFDYFSEHGAGVNDAANTLSTGGRFQPFLLGLTRDSGGSLKHWANGIFAGSPFGTITLPTGGTTGKIRIGCDQGGGNFFKGIISSVAIYNKVLTTAQMLERYNYTMGGAYGLK